MVPGGGGALAVGRVAVVFVVKVAVVAWKVGVLAEASATAKVFVALAAGHQLLALWEVPGTGGKVSGV